MAEKTAGEFVVQVVENLPELKRGRHPNAGKWACRLAVVRAAAGRWCLMANDGHASLAIYLRRCYPDFEFTQRANEDDTKTISVYARLKTAKE